MTEGNIVANQPSCPSGMRQQIVPLPRPLVRPSCHHRSMAFPVRALFDIPEDRAYLNCAYMGPLPRSTAEAGQAAIAAKAQPWNITPEDFFTNVQRYRELVGGLLGDDAEGVAVVPSVSYGMATAAANLAVAPGEEIVVLAEQFPSNLYAWRTLAERNEAWVHAVSRPPDSDWTSALLEHLDRNGDLVSVVAVPNCHWTDGTVVDLVAIGERCRNIGAALVVDLSQSVGARPFDVAAVKPDFVASVTYKWLLGPYGVGFLWVAPHRRDGEPLEQAWTARAGSDDFARLIDYNDDYGPGARRFDQGEAAGFSHLPAAIESLRLITEWGVDAIAGHARACTERIIAGAAGFGYEVAPTDFRADHLIGLRKQGLDAPRLAEALAAEQVHVSIRGDAVRVSAHVFNTEADEASLVAALAKGSQ